MSGRGPDYRPAPATAIAALVVGATIWGLIWYPYRLIEAAGLSGTLATTLTYAVALAVGLPLFRRQLRGLRIDAWLVAIALSSAGCNLGYVLAMLDGQVMRVLLLFYLAPLWTVLLARLFLGERLSRTGAGVIGLSLAGAVTMLWHPDLGAPWPRAASEWLGLAAGFLFALSNVLIRRASHYPIELKTVAVFAGVVLVGGAYGAVAEPATPLPMDGSAWLLVLLVGLVLLAVNFVVQYGLTRVAASRAVVIFLFELVVAATASWWLAGEAMGPREWLGGLLIVAASLFSSRLEA